ncbi:MAG TPA: hypothetical protein VKY26_10990, partial [Actinomycetota bacterium]|nr:hypothetical protein [Actinomycetota bacterium]
MTTEAKASAISHEGFSPADMIPGGSPGADTGRSADWAEAAVREAEDHELAQYELGAKTLSAEEQVLQRIDRQRRRKAKLKEERITMAHGAGGKATHTL